MAKRKGREIKDEFRLSVNWFKDAKIDQLREDWKKSVSEFNAANAQNQLAKTKLMEEIQKRNPGSRSIPQDAYWDIDFTTPEEHERRTNPEDFVTVYVLDGPKSRKGGGGRRKKSTPIF